MGKRLTLEEKIDRFCNKLTKRRCLRAWHGREGQCIECMYTVKGEMLGDAFNDHSHLLEHLNECYITWNVLVEAYKEQGETLAQLTNDIYGDETYFIARNVRAFLEKRLLKGDTNDD